MQTFQADLAIVGAGGAGLRAAIAAAQANPNAKIALISKVYPMRSHTVAAEGGSAAVAQDHDSFEYHFHDTVAGGDWLCEQDVVDYFVHHCPTEMTQLELWGCPWSRRPDGSVNVRRFGGMKIERTWFAADKTGFHMLHTLFQTSLQFPQIQRFDEHFVLDILVDDGHVRGLVAMNMMEGTLVQIRANAVVMATGGAGRVYRYNTNGGIVTGDGMGMALSHGVPLRDMEFVQYHPTGLPGSGILMTEGCRGEGGILVNKNGYRYLQDYTMGGIETDQNCETRIKGLFAVGECSSVGLHGANRLGSNSLAELVVFGRLAGEQATERAATAGNGNEAAIEAQAAGVEQRLKDLVNQDGGENWAKIRDEMGLAMEEGCGIYRTPELMQKTIDKLAELQERFKRVRITDTSSVFNTDLLYTIELGHGLNVAECMAHSAMARKESRGAHQRLDEGCTERDDVNFLKHTLAFRDADGTTRLEYSDVKITTLPPAKRVYGGEADAADKAEAANKKEKANG